MVKITPFLIVFIKVYIQLHIRTRIRNLKVWIRIHNAGVQYNKESIYCIRWKY
jgi:hypothetical protein